MEGASVCLLVAVLMGLFLLVVGVMLSPFSGGSFNDVVVTSIGYVAFCVVALLVGTRLSSP